MNYADRFTRILGPHESRNIFGSRDIYHSTWEKKGSRIFSQ